MEAGNEGFAHHMLIYECRLPGVKMLPIMSYRKGNGHECYDVNMPMEWYTCERGVIAGWAVGSEGNILKSYNFKLLLPLSQKYCPVSRKLKSTQL